MNKKETKTLHLHINIPSSIDRLKLRVQKTINLVRIGLSNNDYTPLSNEFHQVTLASNIKWTPDQSRRFYTQWILANGFRDVVESISTFLEDVFFTLSAWNTKGQADPSGKVSSEIWNDIMVDGCRKFHAAHFPTKLQRIKQALPFSDDIEYDFSAFNLARNCLVHKNGVITPQHCNAENKTSLVIRWQTLQLGYVNEGDKTFVVVTEKTTLKGPAKICLQPATRQKTFELRETITLTSEDFRDLTWTLFKYGCEITKLLDAYGKSKH